MPKDGQAQDDFSVQYDRIDEAIRSSYFWAYLKMIQVLMETLQCLQRWAEGCECHYDLLEESGVAPEVRRIAAACPLRGRRAPSLASGDFMKVAADCLRTSAAEVVVTCVQQTVPEKLRSLIVRDFEKARAFILFILEIKTAHYGTQPWQSFAIGHLNENLARRAWTSAVNFAITRAQLGEPCHGRLCKILQDPLHTQGQNWFSGGAIGPEDVALRQFVVSCRLPFTAERRVEGLHATMHHYLAGRPHHASCYASCSLRLPSLKQILVREPASLDFILQSIRDFRTPLQASSHFFPGHPTLELSYKAGNSQRQRDPELTRLFYHEDSSSLHDRPEVPADLRAADLIESPISVPALASSDPYSRSRRHAAVQHLLDELQTPKLVAALPVTGACFTALQTHVAEQDHLAMSALKLAPAPESSAMVGKIRNMIFMQLLHQNPKRLHYLKADHTIDFDMEDCVVTLHAPVFAKLEDRRAYMNTTPMSIKPCTSDNAETSSVVFSTSALEACEVPTTTKGSQ